ncbi:MAG: EAL domain-containing protein [Acidobacteriota bacterium]
MNSFSHLSSPLAPPRNDVSLRPLYELENRALAGVELSFARHAPGVSVKPETLAAMLESIRGSLSPETFVCVSLGGEELSDPAYPEALASTFAATRSGTSNVCLFFEDSLFSKLGFAVIEQFVRFKRHGFRLGVDIINLQTIPALILERLPADVLRLDPLDALALPGDPQSLRDIQNFSNFAANLLMLPAARGVRSQSQLNLLRDMGVRIGQGPVFSDIAPPSYSS